MTMPEEYQEYDRPEEPAELTAPAPSMVNGAGWSWSPNMLLWSAGAALVLGFGIWFLMTYTAARARAIAAISLGGDNSDDA